MILALETSCDDTCAALVGLDGSVHASVVSSQEVHGRFGGVVPEIAARQHVELIDAVIEEAFARAGATLDGRHDRRGDRRPGAARGAAGRLLRGQGTRRRARAAVRGGRPPRRGTSPPPTWSPRAFEPPFLALIASGGHTLLLDVPARGRAGQVLARTLDDAAGEAFDKGARMLGLGYPGGAALSRLAAAATPRAMTSRPAAARTSPSPASRPRCSTSCARSTRADEGVRADLAASYEHAIVEALLQRVRARPRAHRPPRGSRSAAASPPTASCAPAPATSASSCSCRRSSSAPTMPR